MRGWGKGRERERGMWSSDPFLPLLETNFSIIPNPMRTVIAVNMLICSEKSEMLYTSLFVLANDV